jgi:hypothetical protein
MMHCRFHQHCHQPTAVVASPEPLLVILPRHYHTILYRQNF